MLVTLLMDSDLLYENHHINANTLSFLKIATTHYFIYDLMLLKTPQSFLEVELLCHCQLYQFWVTYFTCLFHFPYIYKWDCLWRLNVKFYIAYLKAKYLSQNNLFIPFFLSFTLLLSSSPTTHDLHFPFLLLSLLASFLPAFSLALVCRVNITSL